MREVVSIEVGGCGVQMAGPTWDLIDAGDGDSFHDADGGARRVVVEGLDTTATYARGWGMGGERGGGVRRAAEACDSLDGFVIYYGAGGGCGSGTGARILQQLDTDYANKVKVGVVQYPNRSPATVQIYNTVLSTTSLAEWCDDVLTISMADHPQLPHALSSIMSAIQHTTTLSELFHGASPYPHLNFSQLSYSAALKDPVNQTMASLTSPTQLSLSHASHSTVMSCNLVYQGWCMKDVHRAIYHVKTNRCLDFPDWCPLKLRFNIAGEGSPGSVTTFCNTAAVTEVFSGTLRCFKKAFAHRAFTHWYIRDGLEEADFTTNSELLTSIITDYKEATTDSTETDSTSWSSSEY